jgi:hypothetical protein
MIPLNIYLDEDFMDYLLETTNADNKTYEKIIGDALTLYKGYVDEAKIGRRGFTADENGKNPKKIILKSLERLILMSKTQNEVSNQAPKEE